MASDEQKQPITMLADRVLVQIPQTEGERRSRAGILIPATTQVSERLAWAEGGSGSCQAGAPSRPRRGSGGPHPCLPPVAGSERRWLCL